jgi:hypothetical protein
VLSQQRSPLLIVPKPEYGLEIYVLSSWVGFVVSVLKGFGSTQSYPLVQRMKMDRVSRDIKPGHRPHPEFIVQTQCD